MMTSVYELRPGAEWLARGNTACEWSLWTVLTPCRWNAGPDPASGCDTLTDGDLCPEHTETVASLAGVR